MYVKYSYTGKSSCVYKIREISDVNPFNFYPDPHRKKYPDSIWFFRFNLFSGQINEVDDINWKYKATQSLPPLFI